MVDKIHITEELRDYIELLHFEKMRYTDLLKSVRTNSYITSTESNGAIIEFIGGEPWLEIDLISKISDYIIGELFRRKHPWAIKFILNVCSNGMLHFDERVQKYLN